MRNLKRALSLALASVMLLGMMVVGTGAAYADVDSKDNLEAIEVMQLLGIMTGDEKGNFNPDKAVTRNEMAVIMVNLMDLKVKDYAGSSPFTDVPAWAEPYVAACYANAIVSGASATTYNGDATVTVAEAALMMQKALGYFQYAADFGEDWKVATVKQASKIDLFDGLSSNANTALTRNDVAQLALNALEADVVDTDGNGGTTIKGEGFEISTGSAKYEKVELKKYDYNSRKDDNVQQLVEKLFEKDVVKSTENDKLGRPATKWENKDTDESVSIPDEAWKVYAGADFDQDVLDDLDDDDMDIVASYYNGTEITDETAREYYTALLETKGLTVELYEDDDDVTVVILEAYAAQIKEVFTDDDDEITKVDVDVYEAGYYLSKKAPATLTIDVEDDEDAYDVIKGYEEDDVLVLYLKGGWNATGANMDKVVLGADDVKSVEGKVTAKSADTTYNGWVKIDGVKYTFSNEYSQQAVDVKSEGTFYLYNDYIIHYDEDANAADDEYLYVVRSYNETDKWDAKEKTYFAEVVFTDGTSKVVELDEVSTDIVNSTKDTIKKGVYSYDVDDGVYELTPVAAGSSAEKALNIEKGKTGVASGITANSKTVYINVELDDGAFDKATVYTSYKNVASFESAKGYVVVDDGVAEYVFIVDGTSTASSSDLVFVAVASKSDLINDDDLGKYYTFNAIVDGKIVEIMVKNTEASDVTTDAQLFDAVNVNSDDVYTKLTAATKNDDFKSATGNFGKAKNEVITIAGSTYAYADDVVLYVIDTDGDIATGSINRNYTADNDETITILFTMDDDEVTTVYVVKTTK